MTSVLRLPFMGPAERKTEIPMSPRRTIAPSAETPASTGANIIRLVEDFSNIEIAELDDEIRLLDLRIQRAHLRREYVEKLRYIAAEYKKKSIELEELHSVE
jgi:hypothetical protein